MFVYNKDSINDCKTSTQKDYSMIVYILVIEAIRKTLKMFIFIMDMKNLVANTSHNIIQLF
jgi:hypothetical protein